ncbi:MAG: hypothetical protein K6F00_01250 [Lachnospiraceae bacterium]|nr:hypothetical protein [Lachnospiraceae bacterium]
MSTDEKEIKVTGIDENGHPVILPKTIDEYYAGVPKRFAGIRKIIMEYDEPFAVEGGSIRGDFALLKAFVADHDRQLVVDIKGKADALRLFFPAYLYGFVEDTFARAIHHKIEGVGYTLRECIGKYEISVREYDNLFTRVIGTDAAVADEAGIIAISRLMYPMNLLKEHKEAYTEYLKTRDEEVLKVLVREQTGAEEAVSYLTEHRLISTEAVKKVLPQLSDTSMAPIVALLLRYTNNGDGILTQKGGRMSLF